MTPRIITEGRLPLLSGEAEAVRALLIAAPPELPNGMTARASDDQFYQILLYCFHITCNELRSCLSQRNQHPGEGLNIV